MEYRLTDWVKISARVPKKMMDKLARLYPEENLSEVLRSLIERDLTRQRVLKAHMKLYGRFSPKHFDESLF